MVLLDARVFSRFQNDSVTFFASELSIINLKQRAWLVFLSFVFLSGIVLSYPMYFFNIMHLLESSKGILGRKKRQIFNSENVSCSSQRRNRLPGVTKDGFSNKYQPHLPHWEAHVPSTSNTSISTREKRNILGKEYFGNKLPRKTWPSARAFLFCLREFSLCCVVFRIINIVQLGLVFYLL